MWPVVFTWIPDMFITDNSSTYMSHIIRIEMFLTCKHLAIIDLILEVFVNDSSSSAHLATLPATSCILHFVVSAVWRYQSLQFYGTYHNQTPSSCHQAFYFQYNELRKWFQSKELHCEALKTGQFKSNSSNDTILDLCVHGHCHVASNKEDNNRFFEVYCVS